MSIILDHVSHVYGEDTAMAVKALNDVNLVLPDGQFIGLIGHTGSGKSTLVQHLKNLGLSQKEVQLRAYEALKLVGLEDEYFYQSPFDLSGGQKRRVAIAGVLAMKPEVLILDEPTAGLDPKGRDEILDQIAILKEQMGITVVLVSHSMDDVARYVDRIIVMNKGSVMYDDVPREVFRHYVELEKIGLAAPQVTYIMKELRDHGMPVSDDVTTIDEAKAEIERYFKELAQSKKG